MANEENDNINLQIHSNVFELKNVVQTMVDEIKALKNLKGMIIVKDDLDAFEATIEELEKNQQGFQRKLNQLLNCFKEKALQELKKWEESERKCRESKKEEVQEVLAQKIDETRKNWIEKAEKSQNILKDWLKNRGIKLSHFLIGFLWLVLLEREEEEEVESLIQRVKSLLEYTSVGEKYSSVIMSFFSVVKSAVEKVELPRNKKTMSYNKKETDELLGLILEEVLRLEIVSNYPSLYPEMSRSRILDYIREKISGMYTNFLCLHDVNVIADEISEQLSLEFEKIWEKIDFPGAGLIASEDGNIDLQISANILELEKLVQSMEEEINNVKRQKRRITAKDDIEDFEAATEALGKELEDLEGKFKKLLMAFEEKAREEKQNWMELERKFGEVNLAPEEDSRSLAEKTDEINLS